MRLPFYFEEFFKLFDKPSPLSRRDRALPRLSQGNLGQTTPEMLLMENEDGFRQEPTMSVALDGEARNWTDKDVSDLKALRADGFGNSYIAAKLGRTRNAISGKCDRLGISKRIDLKPNPTRILESRGRNGLATGINARLAKAQVSPLPPPVAVIVAPEQLPATRCSIFELTNHTCRWPLGDPGTADFCFCGCIPVEGLPYCHRHSRIAYQPARSR
jgi:GcrA cell cycle regulator